MYLLLFFILFFSACSDPYGTKVSGKDKKGRKVEDGMTCELIQEKEKYNPLSKKMYPFYSLIEAKKDRKITEGETLFVVGDLQGSSQSLLRILDETLEKKNQNTRIILFGNSILEKNFLDLLNDILEKKSPQIIALIGNHEMEAVKEIQHFGHDDEKDLSNQILSMIKRDLLVPTFFESNMGLWFSNSYLSEDDIKNFNEHNLSPFKEKSINQWIKSLIIEGKIEETWPASFFYAKRAKAGQDYRLPMIVSHNQKTKKRVFGILSAATKSSKPDPDRGHILGINSVSKVNIKILRIDINREIKFSVCTLPKKSKKT